VRGALSSPSLRLIGKRLLAAIPVLWGVTLVTFLVINVMPGNAASQLLGANATPEQVAELEAKLHLNEPVFQQYVQWLGNVLRGDFGNSFASDQPVTSIISERLPVTLELILCSFVVSLAFTVPVAVIAARRPGGIVDRLSMGVSMVGLSVAPYVLALVLVYVFAVELDVLPAIGYVSISEGGLAQNLRTMILPSVSIGFPLFCFYTRLLRADIVDKMQGEDYVVTAQAKGLGPWRVLLRHALPNSLFGLLTLVALNIGTLIGATVIIESIFALPGIGQALLQSINNRDILVIEAIVLVLATIVVLANLVADLLYAVLDPRIRYERAAS
jgi:peptide/nickel transport system permease protein